MTEMMDRDTLDLLRTSIRGLLDDIASSSTSTTTFSSRLAELGWDEVVADDEASALTALFTITGEVLSNVDALSTELMRTVSTASDVAPTATFLLPSPHRTMPGLIDGLAASTSLGDTVVAIVDGRLVVAPSSGMSIDSIDATDDSLGLVRVSGEVGASDVSFLPPALLETVTSRARWLIAAQLVGIAQRVLAEAVEYTGQRQQYGKPIGVFQALQHRVASAHALVVGAGHLVDEAGRSADPWVSLVAKCMAGRAAEFACTQAQQCYGAIGFTWEHTFHRYLRRMYVLDRMFGEWRDLEHEIGERLQSGGDVPRIGVL